MTIVWLPIINDEASTASRVLVEEHALMLAEVLPVTETAAPAARSGVRVVLACEFTEIKTSAVPPLGMNRKPSMKPSSV
jgi:hypothetical protein